MQGEGEGGHLLVLLRGHGEHELAGRAFAAGGEREAAAERVGHERTHGVAHLLVALGEALVAHPGVLALVADARQHKVIREALCGNHNHE